MKKYRWQLLIILVTGLIVGILLLVQQGGQIDNTVNVTPNPISGGIYTEAVIGKFLRLNPFLDIYNQPDQDIDSLLFNGLVKFGADGMPLPDLAETWGISQNGTVYTFSLRKDIAWHDGTKITAADILFTVELMKSGNALIPDDLQKFWSEIEVQSLSDNLIQFSLPEAFTPFPDYMAFEILPEHLLGGLTLNELIDHPYNLAPVGSGPYQFGRLLVEDNVITGVVLEANEDYYEGKPYLEEIVFMYYPDEEAAWQAYQDGVVDGIAEVNAEILNPVLADPTVNLYSARKPQLSIVFLNLDNPEVTVFQDAAFRRALLKAVDRQKIIDTVYQGQAIQAHGPILPGNWAYYDGIEQIGYDPEGAKAAIASLGISQNEEGTGLVTNEGQEIRFELLVPDTFEHLQMGNMLKTDWEYIGLAVDIIVKPYNEVIDLLEGRDYEAALVDIDFSGAADPDPYPFWGQAQVRGGQNYSQWNNRSASELLEQARINLDYSARDRLYRNFQVIFQEEMPSLPLLYPVYNYAVKTKINGVSIGPFYDVSDRLNSIQTWYILAEIPDSAPTSTSDSANSAED
jgi:peptide/nickel transport system substrate-binding protein